MKDALVFGARLTVFGIALWVLMVGLTGLVVFHAGGSPLIHVNPNFWSMGLGEFLMCSVGLGGSVYYLKKFSPHLA